MYTIICPVYNSERTLHRCIDSVLMQTYENWELILIDDGSSDNSWQIIEFYMKKDSRIKGFHQENKGPGAARNLGIIKASKDYVVFLDSDDFISNDYLELVLEKIPKSDVIFIDIDQLDENLKTIKHEKMSNYSGLTRNEIIRANLTGKMMWGGWRKVVRRSLLIENGIRYSELNIGEENIYTYSLLSSAKEISFVDKKPIYYYVNRSGSQSKLTLDDPYGLVYDVVREQIEKDGVYKEYGATLNALNAVAAIVSFDRITKKYKVKEAYRISKDVILNFKKKHDNNYEFDYKSMDARVKVLVPFLNISTRWFIILACKIKQLLQGKMR